MSEEEKTLQEAYDDGEFVGEAPPPTREQQLLACLTDIGRLVFQVPEGENVEIELSTLVQGVNQLVVSEARLRKALRRLLDANVGGTVTEQAKAREKGAQALKEDLREVFGAQKEAAQALRNESTD